ncbi:MAG: RluA family pseudouridine synthase [Gammaproteobacteria bacterium]|nr:RluA family pseudouridine synthase [Gammaproteobacteria bacterium]
MANTHTIPRPRLIEVDESHSGQRLDNFLIGYFRGVPRSHIYRILRRGEVRINKGRRTPSYRLKPGDVVRIPPVRMTPSAPAPALLSASHRRLRDHIVYQDDDVLVLNKPAGIAVHTGTGVAAGVIEALRELCPQIPDLELVHRLDRDTSGCLLLAKNRKSLIALQAAFRQQDGAISKHYLALVKGLPDKERWEVTAALRKGAVRGDERMVVITPDGARAITRFTCEKHYRDSTLVGVELLTGRTHQVRVHAAHVGHPVAGDSKYGDREFNTRLRPVGLNRLFLHASELTFPHPSRSVRQRVVAPLPDNLSAVLQRLEIETTE